MPALFDGVSGLIRIMNAVDRDAIRTVARLAALATAQVIVEIGSGNGVMARRVLEAHSGCRYIATDISSRMLRATRRSGPG